MKFFDSVVKIADLSRIHQRRCTVTAVVLPNVLLRIVLFMLNLWMNTSRVWNAWEEQSIDLSRILLQCVRTIAPERRGCGGHFNTLAVFLSILTSTWRYCFLECGKGLFKRLTRGMATNISINLASRDFNLQIGKSPGFEIASVSAKSMKSWIFSKLNRVEWSWMLAINIVSTFHVKIAW